MNTTLNKLFFIMLITIECTAKTAPLINRSMRPVIEFWNRTTQSVYVASSDPTLLWHTSVRDLIKIKPNERYHANPGYIAADSLPSITSVRFELMIAKEKSLMPSFGAGQKVEIYRFSPGKTIYVELVEENNQLVLKPQRGVLYGLLPITHSGLSLLNNVQSNDIMCIGARDIIMNQEWE